MTIVFPEEIYANKEDPCINRKKAKNPKAIEKRERKTQKTRASQSQEIKQPFTYIYIG